MKLPYDVGRLPSTIFDSSSTDSISCTAQQWKNYAIVYARPYLYKLLPDSDYKCLVALCQVVELVSQPAFTADDVSNLYT